MTPASTACSSTSSALRATSFHPEVTGDTSFHRVFVDLVRDAR